MKFSKDTSKTHIKRFKLPSISSSSDISVGKMLLRHYYLKTRDKTLPLNEKLISTDKFFFRITIIEIILSTFTFNFNRFDNA